MEASKEQIAEAARLGKEAAEAASTWVIDGNKDIAHYHSVLEMLRDGDPEAYEYLPNRPNLSGEWADDPTVLSLARDITGKQDVNAETQDELAQAFEDAVSEHFE